MAKEIRESKFMICRDTFFYCVCTEPISHKGNHRCSCGGEWIEDVSKSQKIPKVFPKVFPEGFSGFSVIEDTE